MTDKRISQIKQAFQSKDKQFISTVSSTEMCEFSLINFDKAMQNYKSFRNRLSRKVVN